MSDVLVRLALVGAVIAPFLEQPALAQAINVQRLFLSQCAKCHGPNGVPRPIAKGARRFSDPAWSPTVEKVAEAITTGRGEEMPRFKGKFTPAQILSLAEYVLMLRERGTK